MLSLATELENIKTSIVDGTGIRLVLYVNGCPHKCKCCHNQQTWDIENGYFYSIEEVFNHLSIKINTGKYDGLTLSGGDPLFQKEEILKLILKLKSAFPNLNIWVYTGYIYENIKNDTVISKILENINVLVDGPFLIEQKTLSKKFRGSSNQRLLYLKNGEITKIK